MADTGERLRMARIEAGKTLRQTAEETGVAKDTISRLERGLRKPHPLTVARLAKAYGRPTEELLDPKEQAPRSPEEPEDGQRRTYPYPWMGEAFSELLTAWTKTVEQGYSPEQCRVVAAGALDALDAVVPSLAAAWDALPDHEKRERNELRRDLLKLAREAYEYYEQNAEAGAPASTDAHREEIREEIRRRTRAIA